MGAASEAAPLHVFSASSSSGSKSKHLHGAAAQGRRARARDALVFAAGVAAALLALVLLGRLGGHGGGGVGLLAPIPVSVPGPEDGPHTFYDDPDVSYAVASTGPRLTGWDAKRAAWLQSRGLTGRRRHQERVVMVSGSQPEPCRGAGGDHLLLRFLKNKLDYCRLHGMELLYNRDLLHPAMTFSWSKIPIVRAAMLAHPEAEWVWWVDSDAVLTDMDFRLPLATRYAGRNLVVHGGGDRFFVRRSWLGLNAGVFLVRNCQWSLDFLEEWARMGPAYGPEEHARWGKTLRDALSDKDSDVACDQSSLVYLLLEGWDRLGEKVFLESEYHFQGYWKAVVDRLDGIAARYEAVERGTAKGLRRRHAERDHLRYAAARNAAVSGVVPGPAGGADEGWRRPLITHFVGCQPCSGGRNPMYSRESCEDGMRSALAFADDQVLRAYGFRHAALLNDTLQALPFDYPAAAAATAN